MKVFILAGGEGTRLHPDTTEIPKPMVPVDNNKTPFLWYIIQQFKKYNFKDFVFLTGYKSKAIENYFGNGEKFGVTIDYSRETKPLGTGGAILNAANKIDSMTFVLTNGDTYFELNPREVIKKHQLDNTPHVTMATSFGPYKPFKDIGFYVVDKYALSVMDWGKRCNWNRDIMNKLVFEQMVIGYPTMSYFIDIGTPNNYYRFRKYIQQKNGGSE